MGSDAAETSPRGQQREQSVGRVAGVFDNPPGFPCTPPGVDVLEGGKLTSNNVALHNQCGRHYGVKCRTIIHEQHPHIGVLIFQVRESSVQGEGNSIVCGTVTAVCKL